MAWRMFERVGSVIDRSRAWVNGLQLCVDMDQGAYDAMSMVLMRGPAVVRR